MSFSLSITSDGYDGKLVDTENLNNCSSDDFFIIFESFLQQCDKDKCRAIWFRLRKRHAEWLHRILQYGFELHHAQPDYIMVTKWLFKDIPCMLPRFPFTSVGVAGLIDNFEGKVLLIQEKIGPNQADWHFPGGAHDFGESFYQTAEREIREEVGVETKTECILCFAQSTKGRWDKTHYFGCYTYNRPVDDKCIELKLCEKEIANSKWFEPKEILEMPTEKVGNLTKYVVECYLQLKRDKTTLNSSKPVTIKANDSLICENGREWTVFTSVETD